MRVVDKEEAVEGDGRSTTDAAAAILSSSPMAIIYRTSLLIASKQVAYEYSFNVI